MTTDHGKLVQHNTTNPPLTPAELLLSTSNHRIIDGPAILAHADQVYSVSLAGTKEAIQLFTKRIRNHSM